MSIAVNASNALKGVPAVREAIEFLYYDEEEGKAKRGCLNKTEKRGDLRNRFPVRIDQLSLTYDLSSMDCSGLVQALGSEFEGWLPNAASTDVEASQGEETELS